MRSFPTGKEISGILSPGDSVEGKAAFVSRQQNEKAVQECLGVCQFPYGIGLVSDKLVNLLNAAVGTSHDNDTLTNTGERVWNLSRCFNVREGISRKDDILPAKFANEPLPDGLHKGSVLAYEQQNQMLDEYYELRGWTMLGKPTQKKLVELDLNEHAVELWAEGEW